MFKRSSKTTALLLAAAAVISLVPATGANAAAKRLGNKEGTVKQGIAFDGGKYSYYGFRTDEDLTGIYYNKGGDAKDTTSSDLDDYRYNTLSKYGTKYAYAHEDSNEDEYLIDLSTGKIVDDETKEEKRDKAETDLKSKIKRAERYNGTDDKSAGSLASFDQILQGQFGEVWFKYAAWGDTTVGHTPVVNATKTIIGYKLPDATRVANEIKAREIAKINGTELPTLPSYEIGGVTYKYDDGLAASANTFHNYADIVTLLKARIAADTNLAALATITYDKTNDPVTTTTANSSVVTTTTNQNAPLFTSGAVQVGNVVGIEAEVGGKLENIAGLTNVEIGTIKDKALAAKAEVIYGTAESGNEAINQKFYGFSDENGKYIDVSYYANMKVYSQAKGRAVMIDRYDEEDKDAKLTVHLESIDAVAQDKDNIYAIATVTVSGDGAVAGHTTQHFLQKISKTQGSKEDGAYTPKSVTSYLLDTGLYDEEDMQKAYKIIMGQACEGADEHKYLLGITVKGNNLFVTRASDDNVKVYKFNLKNSYKSDIDHDLTLTGGKNRTDVDTPAVVWDDKADEDINDKFDELSTSDVVEDKGLIGITPVLDDSNNDEQVELFGQPLYRHPSVSIDVNGNTWSVHKNTITKFDGIDKKSDIYSVDGAMDAIDVYDDNSLIAWDTDGDRYTTIKEGTAVTEGDGINVNPDINKDKFKAGYYADEKKFYKDGTAVTNQWASDAAGKWYFLDASGIAKTGWYQDATGNWFLLGNDGAMLTGWQLIDGNWFYLNTVSDGTRGAMLTGWQLIGGNWFYLNPVSDGTRGAMKTGWQYINGKWYYLNPVSDGTRGAMLANRTINGYTLGSDGAMI